MPHGKIGVLIVDDSAFVREMIRKLSESDPGIVVVGEAANGREAVAAVSRLKPDIVTMDIEMPVMGGIEAIEEIMAHDAVPILVVTTLSDARTAFDAIAKGALELMLKSELDEADGRSFCRRLRLLASIRVVTRIRSRRSPRSPGVAPPPLPSRAETGCRILAIAASTGGPAALAHLLARLPAKLPLPVLIAQHIMAGFAAGMAGWLNGLSPLQVKLARDGDPVTPGCVHVSPSEYHLAVGRDRRLVLSDPAPGDLHRPSCDRLLGSVAEVYGAEAAGIILTGMGSDGAAGMGRIFAAGGATIAQDRGSSIVFGMNRVAIDAGCIGKVLPLKEIPAEISRLAGV